MLKGLQGCIYAVPSLAEAGHWYARVFETQPHYTSAEAVEFQIEGFELILVPLAGDTARASHGVTACWGVTDLNAEISRMQAIGATLLEPERCLSAGITQATLLDPFGNRLGLVCKTQMAHQPHRQ